MRAYIQFVVAACLAVLAFSAGAQQGPLPYGMPISLETANKIAAGALAEARKNNWGMAVAIADPAGNLVAFQRLDDTQTASVNIAVGKARSAAQFRRPTKVFQELLAKGSNFTYLLGLEGAVPVQGGIPIVIGGKIVGAVGVSGGTGDQDTQCAQAGLDTLK